MPGVLRDRRALAKAVLGGGEHGLRFVLRNEHAYNALAAVRREPHAAHPRRLAAHRAYVALLEPHRLAGVRKQHDVVAAIGQRHADQEIPLVKSDRDDPGRTRTGKLRQRGFLYRSLRRRHEYEMLVVEFLDRHDGGDLLALFEREDVYDRLAPAAARALRYFVDLQPVQPASIGKAQQVVVRVRHEQPVDEIVFLGRGGLFAAAAASLGAVVRKRLRLHVPAVRKRDHHVLRCNQVFKRNILGVDLDHAASRVTELFADLLQIGADHRGDARRVGEDVEQIGNRLHDLPVFRDDLVLLKSGEPLQAQFQDRLCLFVRQHVAAVLEAELRRQPRRAERLGRSPVQHVAHERRLPGLRHQAAFCFRGIWRRLDQRNDFIHVRQGDRKSFEGMTTLTRLPQLEHGAPRDDFATVRDEALDQVLQVEDLRLVVDQRNHVHAKRILQLRLLVEVIYDHLGQFVALELDHHAHAVLVGLVADVRDTLDLLFPDQLGDALEQCLLVHLIGQFVDDDRLPVALADVLEMDLGTHHHTAAAGAIALAHAGHAVDDAGGRKIRRRHDLDQLVDRDLRIRQQRQTRVHHFRQIVRRDVGRHPHRDARRTVDEQVGNSRRHDERLVLGAVVIRPEVNGLLVDVDQQLVPDPGHADFGVTHGGGVVAVDRPEVALSVDEHVAQREVLRHADDRVVDGRVAVRVVLADDVADDARRFLVSTVPVVGQFVHRVQNPPVHRLQTVAHVRQRTPDDHAHRVIQV